MLIEMGVWGCCCQQNGARSRVLFGLYSSMGLFTTPTNWNYGYKIHLFTVPI